MRGPGLVGYEPAQVRWSHDSARVYFQWKLATDKEEAPMDTYTANRDGSGLRKLPGDEIKQLPPAGGDSTRDHRLTVYSSTGDSVPHRQHLRQNRQLTKTTDVESNPRFTRDGQRISFTRGGNLYVMSLEGGTLVQMTDIRSAAARATSRARGRRRAGRLRRPRAGRPGRGATNHHGGRRPRR